MGPVPWSHGPGPGAQGPSELIIKSPYTIFLRSYTLFSWKYELLVNSAHFLKEISKKFNLKKNLLIKTIQNFKGLKYRQQIIFKNRYLTIINDSKSTSFSSSIGVLKANKNIHWLLGGIHKKGDKFELSSKINCWKGSYPSLKTSIIPSFSLVGFPVLGLILIGILWLAVVFFSSFGACCCRN